MVLLLFLLLTLNIFHTHLVFYCWLWTDKYIPRNVFTINATNDFWCPLLFDFKFQNILGHILKNYSTIKDISNIFRKTPAYSRIQKYLALQPSSLLKCCLQFYFQSEFFNCSLTDFKPGTHLKNKKFCGIWPTFKKITFRWKLDGKKCAECFCDKHFINNNIRNLILVTKWWQNLQKQSECFHFDRRDFEGIRVLLYQVFWYFCYRFSPKMRLLVVKLFWPHVNAIKKT